jgi:hypothetical protein
VVDLEVQAVEAEVAPAEVRAVEVQPSSTTSSATKEAGITGTKIHVTPAGVIRLVVNNDV